MVVVVGLGNPGRRYAGTRHNMGFEVADRLAGRLASARREALESGAALRGRIAERDVALVWPATFMNRSGDAALEAVERFEAVFEDLLIVTDDVYLPLGRLRLRVSGSDGGHNGLASVLAAAGHTRVPRLRVGVGVGVGRGDTPADLVEFVLSEFAPEERPIAARAAQAAAACVERYVAAGSEAAMNEYNGRDLLASPEAPATAPFEGDQS